MIATPAIELASVSDALAALDHATQTMRASEVGQVLAIAALCDLHRVDETKLVAGCERWVRGGADGTPQIGEFIAAELGGILGVSPASAMVRIATILNVRHRHPALWAAVIAGRMRFYEAGQIADTCVDARLGAEACWWVDRQCAIALLTQPWARVRPKVAGWILMADPDMAAERALRAAETRKVGVGTIVDGHCDLWGRLDAADGIAFDQALTTIAATLPTDTDTDTQATAFADAGDGSSARASLDQRRAAAVGILARQALGQPELPRAADIIVRIDATAHGMACPADPGGGTPTDTAAAALVLSPVAEVEGWGPVLTTQLRSLVDGCKVTVRPVIDARNVPVFDGYEVPDTMRLAVTERWPVDAFPYGTLRSTACDADHTQSYGEGGRTEVDNLAPVKRFGHRVRTHGGWRVEQPEPGWLMWTSPYGYTYAVTPSGTLRIGRPPPQEQDWWNQEPPDWLDS